MWKTINAETKTRTVLESAWNFEESYTKIFSIFVSFFWWWKIFDDYCLQLFRKNTDCFDLWPMKIFYSAGRGDSSHLILGVTPRTPLFEGKITENQTKCYYHQKGQVIFSKWPRFQPHTTNVTIFFNFSKKKDTFLTLVKFGWSQSPVYVQFIIPLWKIIILIWNLLRTLL